LYHYSLVRLSWKLCDDESVPLPLTRRGVGGALRMFIVNYMVPKAKKVELEDDFEAAYEAHKWRGCTNRIHSLKVGRMVSTLESIK
jgi:hypothetical protein